jgi:glycosyltransferase involved in cell wall biosynthesis
MNLVFISNDIFPNQHAAAIRNSTIVQGIVESGHKVKFFLLSAQDWETSEIIYKGIEFKTLNNFKGKNKILRELNFFKSLLKLKNEIKKINSDSAIDAIIIYALEVSIIRFVFFILKKKRIRIFHERTELPFIGAEKDSFLGKIKYNYYLYKLIPQFDGLFVISDKLHEFFYPLNKNIKKVLTVVDTEFFNTQLNSIFDFPYVAYCGTMSGDKDGLPILIQSFAKLSKNFPNHKLLLIGNNSDFDSAKKHSLMIEQSGIKDKVVFTGLVDREEMPQLLGNADILVVSKPDNLQNSANFPIKIGEYLSTGVPVVVTSVGEIPKFIIDRESGFLALPNNVESFYIKMYEVLSDYERAKQIGINGRKLAQKVFDYKIQSREMIEFINEIITK